MHLFILFTYFIHIFIYFLLCLFAVFTFCIYIYYIFIYLFIYFWLIVTKASFAPNIRPERRLVGWLLNNELERMWKENIEL